MKTLIVRGKEPVPAELRSIVERGSTSLDEVSTGELSTFVSREGLGVDRMVFWAGASDPDVRSLALNYATAAGAERPETIVFVTRTPSEAALDGLSLNDMFVWPRDEDKLKLVFLTTA